MNEGTMTRREDIETCNVESMEITDEDVPPLSSYVAGWRFWWKFAMWPGAFLLLNTVVFTTLVSFDEWEVVYDRSDVRLKIFKTNSAVVAVMLLIDTVVLFRAAIFLEKQVVALDADGEMTDESSSSSNHVHAQVSRRWIASWEVAEVVLLVCLFLSVCSLLHRYFVVLAVLLLLV